MRITVRLFTLFCILAILAVNITGCQTKENISTPTDSGSTAGGTKADGAKTTNMESEDPNVNKPNKNNEFSEYINYRALLPNTYKKLNEDKNLKVVYFGGSVTDGYGASNANSRSWRALVGSWLKKEFPKATVKNINRALGGAGTYLSAYRLEHEVLPEKPDLVFLEFSINDSYSGATYQESASQFETIIRELKTALPDADIVTVLVTDKNQLETNKAGKLHIQAQAHEDIAKAYNISTIHAGRYLASIAKYDADEWAKYAIDSVHLNDAGYEVYYRIIQEFMKTCLFEIDYSKPYGKFVWSEQVSDTLFDGNRTTLLPSQDLLALSEGLGGTGVTWTNKSSFGNQNVGSAFGQFLFDRVKDVLVIQFNGTEIGAYVMPGVSWQVSIDGGAYKKVDQIANMPMIFATGLESGEHTIKLRLYGSGSVAMGAIFTRDSSLATKKS